MIDWFFSSSFKILQEKYNSDIPNTIEDLCKLKVTKIWVIGDLCFVNHNIFIRRQIANKLFWYF